MIADLGATALRRLEPETAHGLTIRALKLGLGPADRGGDDPRLATTLAGLRLANPIGLAAGFDKNAEVAGAMLRAGFGFAECGTITPRAQAGNPRPRLFRLSQDRAVINRMGFNNEGMEAVARRLEARPRPGVVGLNIGANKDSQDRTGDYVAALERLWQCADYFTANVSSPNTPGLRSLQSRTALEDLLGRLTQARRRLVAGSATTRPLFLKVAPDLTEPEVDDICEVVAAAGFEGVVVSNTTIARPPSLSARDRGEAGGLSGAPLFGPSTEILKSFAARLQGRVALVGAGGIASGRDAYAKIRAGASAVQLYSALVYGGPSLVGRIRRELSDCLAADGFANVADAVGAGS